MEAPPEALELRNLWDHRDSLPPNAKEKILESLDLEGHWTARLYAVRLIPFLTWNAEQRRGLIERLFLLERGENLFVRAWALDSLAHLSDGDPDLGDRVTSMLVEALGSTSGAVRARAKAALKRLS